MRRCCLRTAQKCNALPVQRFGFSLVLLLGPRLRGLLLLLSRLNPHRHLRLPHASQTLRHNRPRQIRRAQPDLSVQRLRNPARSDLKLRHIRPRAQVLR